jgi:hypothetical protein
VCRQRIVALCLTLWPCSVWGAPPPAGRTGVWASVPSTRPLTHQQAEALLEADWLEQVLHDPTVERIRGELEAARRIARRLAAHPKQPDFSLELVELTGLADRLDVVSPNLEAGDEHRKLYLAVRRVKRRITMRNPLLDFSRVLLIDGSPPAGHESGHRCKGGPARILVLDRLNPDADVREVVPALARGVMRMDLSFDATRLVYSSQHLYEVSLDANGVPVGPPRQLTNSAYHDVDPIYLPDGKIIFCTTRGNTYVRCLPGSPCTVLARCDADGGNIRIISLNSEPDYTPSLLPDGRVLYTRWEYTERPLWRLQKLWTMNPDGTAVAHYWGNRSSYPDVTWEARPVPGTGKVMFTGVGHHSVEGGPIGIVDVGEGRDFPDGLYKVTAEAPWSEVMDPPADQIRIYSPVYRASPVCWRFCSPYPLSDHDFLVSADADPAYRERRARLRREGYRLYLMDVEGNRELIYAGTGPGGVWCALPLRPRTPPPVIPERAAWPKAGQQAQEGVLYSANVLEGVDGLPAGKAKYLRVLQQDHKTYSTSGKSFRHGGPTISALQEDAVKRILGTVPLAADGSVSFKAPAGKAIYFQLLDENHRCLQIMRSFTGVMPGEVRGCLGCHEQHSGAPAVTGAARAMSHPPAALTPPPWGAEVSVSYERFAQPVLDKHCGKCHQGEGKGRAVLDLTLRGGVPEKGIDDPRLLPFKEPYLTLIGDTAWMGQAQRGAAKGKGYGLAGALPVEAGRYKGQDPYGPIPPLSMLSYASPLIDLVTKGKHNGVKIEGEDLLRLIAWVDCNCVYRGEEEVRQIPDPPGGRCKTRTAPVIDRLQPVTDPPATNSLSTSDTGVPYGVHRPPPRSGEP